jgi:hypothetical protein
MKTFLEHAHALGLAAASEDDARDKVLAFAAQQSQTLKLLGLTPATPATGLASKIGDLQATAGRVPALEQRLAAQEAELGTHRADKSARDKAELDQHIAELFVVQPELKVAEEAVRYQAEHDRAAFAKKYPRPTPDELVQAAQHGARLAPIVPPAQRPPAPGTFALTLGPQAEQGVPPQVAAQGAPVAVDAGSLVASLAATAGAYLRAALPWSMDDFLRVFDLDGDGAVAGADEAAFVRVVCMAETEVDEALASSHGAPFVGEAITDSIREIVALRVPWCAVRGRALADAEKNPLSAPYKASEERLKRLREDRGARIPGQGALQPTASYAGVVAVAPSFWNGGRY